MVAKSSVAAQHYSDTTKYNKHAWKGGIFRRFPWVGILALIGALACILAAIAVLAYSDGKSIATWKYSPSVYVSIAYTIANVLLQDALGRGIVVAWWTTAIRDGTTIRDLHNTWDYGHSALAAARSGRHFNFVAFAALFLAITPINGPLLQRSSEVDIRKTESRANVTIRAAKEIDFPTGYMSGRLRVVPLLHENFTPVFQAHQAGQSIAANHTGCAGDGVCSGHLSAAGLAVNCSSYTVPYNVVPDEDCNSLTGSTQQCIDAISGFIMFQSNISWWYGQPGQLNLNVQYKDQSACTGEMMIQNCTLRAATVQYPVTIDGNSSTIALDLKSSIFDDVVETIGEYKDPGVQGPTQLGGYAHALSDIFYGQSHIRWAGAVGYEVLSNGPAGTRFANLTAAQKEQNGLTQGLCNIFFNDPVPDLLQQARELMFRTALTGSNATHLQTVELNEVRTAGVYQSNYAYLGAAAAVSLLAIFIVLATFNQFWLLGRKVTMSPVEIAKAFNAPILAPEHPNAEVEEMVKDAGSKPVQYGVAQGVGGGVGGVGPFQTPQGPVPVYFEGAKGMTQGQVRGVSPDPMHLAMGDPNQVQALISR